MLWTGAVRSWRRSAELWTRLGLRYPMGRGAG